jgi:hypothetical protein
MIADILRLGKGLLPKLLIPAVIVLVGVAAFGLGRLSGLKAGDRGLIIHTSPAEVDERADYAP